MTAASPRFSVVIPAYNAAAYLGQTIKSVIAQTATSWELIVVDDGSTDTTCEVSGAFHDPRIVIISQQNRGVSVARNAGLSICRGDYVLLLDADDLLFADALQRLGDDLDRHPDAVLSYGTCTRFETTCPAAPRPPFRLRRKPHSEALASLLARDSLVTGAVLVRRNALDRISGFDRELTIGEDWAFWCDVAAAGPISFIGGAPVLAYRLNPQSAMRVLGNSPCALWPAIDFIFASDAVQRRFTTRERRSLRRRAEASAFASAMPELLRARNWRQAFAVAKQIVKRDPIAFVVDGVSLCLSALDRRRHVCRRRAAGATRHKDRA